MYIVLERGNDGEHYFFDADEAEAYCNDRIRVKRDYTCSDYAYGFLRSCLQDRSTCIGYCGTADDVECCSICLVAELDSADQVVKFPCSHEYCFKCAVNLAERNKQSEGIMFQCPLCRKIYYDHK